MAESVYHFVFQLGHTPYEAHLHFNIEIEEVYDLLKAIYNR